MRIAMIQQKIYDIRGQKVMLDFDLASLYGTETRTLKQAVKRNLERFPKDFMFRLSTKEWKELITICDKLTVKVKFSPALPFAFNEHGVTMLASVLKTRKAAKMNIAVVRAFITLKQFALDYKDLAEQIKQIRQTVNGHRQQLNHIYDVIEHMLEETEKKRVWEKRERIGFKK